MKKVFLTRNNAEALGYPHAKNKVALLLNNMLTKELKLNLQSGRNKTLQLLSVLLSTLSKLS